MGGSVGLKGTDGRAILLKAINLGAKPSAFERTKELLTELKEIESKIRFLTCPGIMGGNILKQFNFEFACINHSKFNNVEQRSVLLRTDFTLDADAVLKAVDDRTKMIFLCSPNNPTSNSLDREVVMRIIREVNCMVVVDEAYIDFSRGEGTEFTSSTESTGFPGSTESTGFPGLTESTGFPGLTKSMLSHVPEKKNLVVLQTLSKAWGLAGIRLGMVFAHEELIGYLSNVKYPYNINSLTMESALKSLADQSSRENWVNQILEERRKLNERLKSFAFVKRIFPSDANFLLVKMEDPSDVYEFLMNRGIIVRDRSSVPLCEGCLRITVGTEAENLQLCDALDTYNQTKDNV